MKKTIVTLAIISILGLSGCTTEKEATFSIPKKETVTIGSGELVKNPSFIGYTEPMESSNVGAKTGGRIVNISAQKGDRVKAGQVLAIIDGQEAQENSVNASNMLASTQSVYGSTSALFDAQIASMKEKISQAEQGITVAESALKGASSWVNDTENASEEGLKTIEKQVEQSELALDTANTQYKNTEALLDQKERDVYLNAQNTLHSAGILAANLLDATDMLYGASDRNRHANDAFETYFGGRDATLRPKWESMWLQNKATYDAWKPKIDALSAADSSTAEGKKQILDTLKESETFFESLRTFAGFTYSCLEASIPTSTFTDSTIAASKTQMTSFQSNIETALLSVSGNYITGIKGSIQNIGNITNERTLQLSLLQKQITLATKSNEIAKQNLTQYSAGSTGKINEISTKAEIAKGQLEIAKGQYKEAKAALAALEKQKDAQLSTIASQMTSIRGGRALADIAIGGATVTAPFDGVITEKFASVGQVVSAGLPIFTVARDDTVKLRVLVGESESGNFKAGDGTVISYGENESITGTISVIQPFADMLSKKISIEIHLGNADRKLILGSYANVSFQGNSISGKLIPYRFVEYSYGKSILHVMRGDSIQKVEVTLNGCNDTICVINGSVEDGETAVLP